MKNILFVIHRLDAGGAEKSLVSLLNSLPLDDLNLYLMAINPNGIFKSQLPQKINMIEAPNELICETAKITKKIFWTHSNLKTVILKIWSIIRCRLRSKKSKSDKSHDQYYNEIWRKYIPDNSVSYDVAISYMDCVNYYVIDHINAKKKILWCHNDYNKLEYKAAYDLPYYEKAYKICTISELCKKSLIENFPSIQNKFEVIENISSARVIYAQAEILNEMKDSNDGFINDKRFRIISIGRLTEQKGLDYAVDAAKFLKEKGLDFCWYIIGEGPLRKSLEKRAFKQNVSKFVKFIGIRSNPYPYIKLADIFVMPSRYEGKSIALDEAKILCKPIIVTKYPSVYDAIDNGINGILSDIDASAIAKNIVILYQNKDLRNKLISNLRLEDNTNEKQVVEAFLNLIN